MKTLVTGGAGYIGSVVVSELIRAGDEVVVLDNLSQGHRAAVHPEAVFVEGDLADRRFLDKLMAELQPEGIMHFASNTLVGESMEEPFLYLGDNIRNGLNLLQSAVDHGSKRFVLSSTANLFDEPNRIPIAADETIVPGSRVYNLGNGQGFSVKEVIDMARQVTGHPIPAVIGRRRTGDPAMLIADSGKTKQEIDWQPTHSDLQNILETAWAWHQKHPHGYEDRG